MTRYWTRRQTTHFITLKVFLPFFPGINFSPSSRRAAQRKQGFSGWDRRNICSTPLTVQTTASLPSEGGLRPLRCLLPSLQPVGMWPCSEQHGFAAGTASVRVSNPLPVIDWAGRALGNPLGSGLTSRNDCVVFCAVCLAKSMNNVWSDC